MPLDLQLHPVEPRRVGYFAGEKFLKGSIDEAVGAYFEEFCQAQQDPEARLSLPVFPLGGEMRLKDNLAPDLVEPIVGWRIWRFAEGHDPSLHSLSRRGPWLPRRAAAAICFALPPSHTQARSHLAPEYGCSCGLWAWKEESDARRFLQSLIRLPLMHSAPVMNPILGQVALWGNVVEHERGYRAAFAYPTRLRVPAFFRTLIPELDARRVRRVRAPEAAQLLQSLYGVDAVVEGTVKGLRRRSVHPDQQRLFS